MRKIIGGIHHMATSTFDGERHFVHKCLDARSIFILPEQPFTGEWIFTEHDLVSIGRQHCAPPKDWKYD